MAQPSKVAEQMAAKRKDTPDDIIVIDNAVSDPIALRTRALQAPFTDLEIPGDGVYPRSCIVDIPELVESVRESLATEARESLSVVGTGFRLCYGGEEPQSFVHEDTGYGSLSAVLYLTLPDHCAGGTAFWKNKATGYEYIRPNSLDNFQLTDRNLAKAWKQTRLVEMKFNRLVIYPSNRFHSRWPHEAFGTGPENGRLTAVGFFNEESRETQSPLQPTGETQITIREAVLDPLDDVEFVLKSGKKFYLESGLQKLGDFQYLSLATNVRDMIKSGNAIILIAEKKGQRIGGISAVGYPLHFNQSRIMYQEQWWWVDPLYRGTGAGRMLLEGLEKEAAKRGGAVVVMMHLPTNKLSSTYKKAGYFPGETLFYKVLQ